MAQRQAVKALRDEPIAENAGLLHSTQSMHTWTDRTDGTWRRVALFDSTHSSINSLQNNFECKVSTTRPTSIFPDHHLDSARLLPIIPQPLTFYHLEIEAPCSCTPA